MEKQFSYQHTPVNYRTEGEGMVVVLVHGFPEDHHIFDDQVAVLKEHYRLIIPDLPGSGKSAVYKKDADVSITDYALVIAALLEEEKVESCVMLGHSMGGYITLAFAEQYPQKLKAFGLIHSTAFEDSDEKKLNRKRSVETMEKYGAYAFLKSTVPNLFSAGYKAAHADKIGLLIERGNKFPVEALQQYYIAMMNRPDRTSVLRGSDVPVLFIIGTEDGAAPLKDVIQQVHLPAVAHFHILEGVAHMSMWEATDELNSYLYSFLETV